MDGPSGGKAHDFFFVAGIQRCLVHKERSVKVSFPVAIEADRRYCSPAVAAFWESQFSVRPVLRRLETSP
ncbi:hypothetical protein [Roseimaritima multifibrata]|uniref:hypothetical protein n=1 Tax=Roseimaritima multifibrata TaxID=1930274 RepID=UPI0011A89838|nr:hypothetical protein [Roseimaritima multifibrata]